MNIKNYEYMNSYLFIFSKLSTTSMHFLYANKNTHYTHAGKSPIDS